jgi:hypothetical protein
MCGGHYRSYLVGEPRCREIVPYWHEAKYLGKVETSGKGSFVPIVRNYRTAHGVSEANRRGDSNTEDVRRAMRHYRELFGELLEPRQKRWALSGPERCSSPAIEALDIAFIKQPRFTETDGARIAANHSSRPPGAT